jgi:glucokinase
MAPAVIAVDLGGTNLRSALVRSDGEIFERRKESTRASDGWKHVVRRLIGQIEALRQRAAAEGIQVAAVGVGAPGVIRADQGTVVKSPNFPDWNNLPLRKLLEDALSIPVVIENDANAAALGEQWRGAGRDVASMILLTLGTGVGGGIILNKRIWHGADGMAGEIGHMTLVPDGRPCSCGNCGCLEMYASSRGILRSYEERSQPESRGAGPATSEEVYEAARNGDPLALSVMGDMGRMLGIGLANLINIFNPERIVIGGGVKDAWPLFIEAARQEISRRAFEVPAKRSEIVQSLLGDDAGVIGAAAVALQMAA